MNCRRCHGLIWDFEDDLPLRCLSCGRSSEPLPTRAELVAAGIMQDTGVVRKKEMVGRKGRGVEYNPAPFHPPGRYARRDGEQGSR